MKPSLLKRIEKHLADKANPDYGNWKPKPRLKPSDLGTPCERKLYYSFLRTKEDNPTSVETKKIFDIGDAFHDMIKNWIEGTGCLIKYLDPRTGEVPIDKWSKKPNSEFPIVVPELEIITGKIDAILSINKELWVGEFKSCNAKKFAKLGTGPNEKDKMQANTYVHLFEHCRAQGMYDHIEELAGAGEIKGVIFLYINKDTGDIKEFIVEREAADLEAIVMKYAKLKQYVENKELPERTEDYCNWCPWNQTCKKNINPLK